MGNKGIFGNLGGRCVHQFSWPRLAHAGDYYQVCVLCGDEYAYDWHRMRRLGRKPVAAVATRTKAPTRVARWKSRARRIHLCGPIRYRPSGTDVWMNGELKNISKSGVLFAASSPVSEGTWIEIELDMPSEIVGGNTAHRVRCAAEITRTVNDEQSAFFGAQIFGYEFVPDGLS